MGRELKIVEKNKIEIIGICGGSASGKSTISQLLKSISKDRIEVISLDSYYKSYDELTLPEKRKINYDHPDAFDIKLLVEQLRMLKKGSEIDIPIYSFETYSRCKDTTKIKPKRFIILEGMLILHFKEIREVLTKSFFIDADEKTRLNRMVERDVRERGRTTDWIIYQYMRDIKPMHEEYVEPQKKIADYIIDGNNSINKNTEQIMNILIENGKKKNEGGKFEWER